MTTVLSAQHVCCGSEVDGDRRRTPGGGSSARSRWRGPNLEERVVGVRKRVPNSIKRNIGLIGAHVAGAATPKDPSNFDRAALAPSFLQQSHSILHPGARQDLWPRFEILPAINDASPHTVSILHLRRDPHFAAALFSASI